MNPDESFLHFIECLKSEKDTRSLCCTTTDLQCLILDVVVDVLDVFVPQVDRLIDVIKKRANVGSVDLQQVGLGYAPRAS